VSPSRLLLPGILLCSFSTLCPIFITSHVYTTVSSVEQGQCGGAGIPQAVRGFGA
jgi:hypothetical protein